MNDLPSNLERIEKEYGVKIITPQSKLDSYIEGLKLVRGNHIAEAGQWDAIGDQYNRMNQMELAKAAYQCAINALQKVDTSQGKNLGEKEKLQFEEDIMQWKMQLIAKTEKLGPIRDGD